MRPSLHSLVFRSTLIAATLASASSAAQPDEQKPSDRPPTETARPGPKQGDVVQTDTLGMNLVSWNLDSGKTTTVADQAGLSEFVGAHYFVADKWRVGMNFQFTELLTTPPKGTNPFWTFALLPQVGWHFYDPFFAAAVFTFAPRTRGAGNLDMGVQAVLGAGLKLADGVRLTGAIEVPYNFYVSRTIGITPLLGLSVKL
jgi:hypothetical protein